MPSAETGSPYAAGMLVAVSIAAVLGALAARSIVAEADAHRLDLADRWVGPVCVECGGSLDAVLTTCTESGHQQRSGNAVVVVATVVLSGLLPIALPSFWVLPAYLVFVWTMILLTVTDLDTKLIPNRILGPATSIGAVLLTAGYLFDSSAGRLLDAFIGGASYLLVMVVLALLVKGGLGFGDVKLAFLIGVFTGYLGLGHTVVAGFGSFLFGGLAAAFLLITRKSGRKDAIPFGPFMTAAALVSVLVGQSFLDWYLG